MSKDIFKNTHFNKISRNEVIENDKFGIMKKFGFMSSFMSTTMQSKNKSFNDENILNTEISNKNKHQNKSFATKKKQILKPIIFKTKTLKKNKIINKESYPIRKCHNIFSYAQKLDLKMDNKKNNKIGIISKKFLKSYSLGKYTTKNDISNNITTIRNDNKCKKQMKTIAVNHSLIVNKNKNKNKNKIRSNENVKNKNYKLKYKFLFGQIKLNENNINNNIDSNSMSIISDENDMSTKREKDNIFEENHLFNNDMNDNNENNDTENIYDINDKFSSEIISEKYYMNKYNIVEPCKNFNLIETKNIEENLCELDNDISEKRSNDNNIDNNSNILNKTNIINNNNTNFIFFMNKEKDKEIYDKSHLKKNLLSTKLLKNNASCNISPRNDLTEISKIKNNKQPYDKNYKFISDIQRHITNIPELKIQKFLNLNDYCIFRLMGFMFDYSSILIRSNSLIKSKIKSSFNNIFSNAITNFSKTYSLFLKVINYYFENRQLIINKKISYTFNLVIICKVISKDINKSYDISYNYISNNKEYDNLWKIDIKKKNNIKLWLHTELFKENNYSKLFTYSSQISSFSYGDEIKFVINIFSENQQLNPISIQWITPTITDIEDKSFEVNKFISNNNVFDPLRCNEIEIQTLIWEEVPVNKNNNVLLHEFLKIFEKFFIIKGIYTYTSKHIFYKIKTVANKKGVFPKNKFLLFDLNIIDYDEPLKNEIQSIYLMNSNFYTKKMDVRYGTIIIFYITDYKS